ncbi:MAG: FAD-dependent oxidoreductase [Halioglobus sp.]
MSSKKMFILAVVIAAVFAVFYFDVTAYLQLDALRESLDDLVIWKAENPLTSAIIYFAAYVAVTGLSIPGAAIMTLAGGALFGFWFGLLLVSFASSIGATLAFLVSRTLLRDWVQEKFGSHLTALNDGFEREGAFYLFTLRLVPLFPFFVINLLMGLLPISAWRFYWVSQLGMLAATAVYVNAGTQLAEIDGLAGIVSPPLLISFILLGIFPLLAKWFVNYLQSRKVLEQWTRPEKFDTNMVVIGAGSAGLVTALIAATVKAKVTLIERHKMGGDCLNTGCVPSKALIRSARIADYARRAPEFGLGEMTVDVDFPAVMSRVESVIKTIEPHDSVERFTDLGVDCVSGDARIVSPWEVEVNGEILRTENIVIASGARARELNIPGLDQLDYLTSDSLWDIREAPGTLLVVGAGPIGCELAQAFARLGTKVKLVTHSDRILPREDEDVVTAVAEAFQRNGIEVYTGYDAQQFSTSDNGQSAIFKTPEGDRELSFDRVLLAVGRTANTEGLGLEELGIELTRHKTIAVDDYLRTKIPTILAAGDIVGPYQFTHMASHQAWFAAVNALFGRFKRFKVDYSIVPWATFTDPEVARVGLNEMDALEQNIPHEVTRYGIDDLDRAIADGEAHGFIKVLTVPGKDKILGATIVGYHAAELITEFVMAMKHGIGLKKILGTIHIYPTLSESNKFLAGQWQKERKPEKLLSWLERYHSWTRG